MKECDELISSLSEKGYNHNSPHVSHVPRKAMQSHLLNALNCLWHQSKNRGQSTEEEKHTSGFFKPVSIPNRAATLYGDHYTGCQVKLRSFSNANEPSKISTHKALLFFHVQIEIQLYGLCGAALTYVILLRLFLSIRQPKTARVRWSRTVNDAASHCCKFAHERKDGSKDQFGLVFRFFWQRKHKKHRKLIGTQIAIREASCILGDKCFFVTYFSTAFALMFKLTSCGWSRRLQ